jgi:hypothetical protein
MFKKELFNDYTFWFSDCPLVSLFIKEFDIIFAHNILDPTMITQDFDLGATLMHVS